MSDSTRAQLQEAYQLIKSGQNDAAIAIIRPIITIEPNNADAWWLLANASTDSTEKRRALETVLRLKPDHAQAQSKLNELRAAEDFSFDEPATFGGLMSETEKPKRDIPTSRQEIPNTVVVQPPRQGTNPLVIILAIVGLLVLLVCAACVFLPMIGLSVFGPQIEQQLDEMVGTLSESVTGLPEMFGTLGAISMPRQLDDINNLENKGSISRGESRDDTLSDSFEYHGYTFTGDTGQSITIDVAANGGSLDPQVALYDPNGILINFNDDISFGDNRDSRLTMTLPSSGEYTIVVSSFASDGAYTLEVR